MSYAYRSGGLNVGGVIAALVFMATWALFAIMGGLWGALLGWLPASILAAFCVRAWPLVLAVVVVAVFGIAAIVKQNTGPQPATDPYASIATPVSQAPAQDAPAVQAAAVARVAAPAIQATPADQFTSEPAHAFQVATFDVGVAKVFRGVPLHDANPSELNAIAEACPSHTVAFDQSDGAVCGSQGSADATSDSGAVLVRVIETSAGNVGCDVVPTYKPDTGGFVCEGRSWVVAPIPKTASLQNTRAAVVPNASPPVPAAPDSQQVAQR